nr:HNH endonuclease [Paenibacillus sp. F411]
MFRSPEAHTQISAKKKTKIPTKIKKSVFERDGYRCRYCDSYKDLTADHIFPESRGGEASLENLVTACSECNSRKGARTPEEAGMRFKDISS